MCSVSQEPAEGACGTLTTASTPMITPHLSQSHTHLLSHLSLPWHLHYHQVFHTQTLPWTIHSPNQLSCCSFNQWIKTVCVGVGEWVGGWVEQRRRGRTEKVSNCYMHSWMDERYPARKKKRENNWMLLSGGTLIILTSFFFPFYIYLFGLCGGGAECMWECSCVSVMCVWKCSCVMCGRECS